MNAKRRIKILLNNPFTVIFLLDRIGITKLIPDKMYLKIKYRAYFHKKLNLNAPVTFSEKLQWLKLYDHNEKYTMLVDKYLVKDYVSKVIGEQYIIPTIGVWDDVDEIPFEKLPREFVIKCTHDSGGVVIVKDKELLDYDATKKALNKSLNRNYYWNGREWPYKNVQPRIIAEKYMEDEATEELRDYKFFVFDGIVKALFVASDRQDKDKETTFDFYDADFQHLDIRNGHPNTTKIIDKPVCFEEMKQLASQLGKGLPEARIDFYEVDGKVYFGEITFFHHSGFTPFEPEEWDYKLGELLVLPDKKRE